MGMEKVTYLGAFIVAKRKVVEEFNVKLECPNGHKKGKSESFCPKCGSATIERRIPKITKLSIYDLMNEELVPWKFEDVMQTFGERDDDEDILTPNRRGYGIDLEEYEGNVSLMDPNKATNEVERLKKDYKEFLDAITPHYESIEILYGITSWYR